MLSFIVDLDELYISDEYRFRLTRFTRKSSVVATPRGHPDF